VQAAEWDGGGRVASVRWIKVGALAWRREVVASAGRVRLPRFYDRALPLSGQERELLARLPFDEKLWLADAGDSGAASGEAGFTTLERIWAWPTAEVNGMWGGHTGPGSKTIIPKSAHAEVARLLRGAETAAYLWDELAAIGSELT
jgi:hypothetical protein